MYRALYTHVPKTGGTSIKDALESHKDSLVITENSSVIKEHPNMNMEHIGITHLSWEH